MDNMKINTILIIIKKDYTNIKDDDKTIDKIWNNKSINIFDKITIC